MTVQEEEKSTFIGKEKSASNGKETSAHLPLPDGEGRSRAMHGGGVRLRGVRPAVGLCLLSSAYFPPVQWMQKLHRYRHAIVERCDNFQKQTYRNRCIISTANGPQALTVPIEKYDGAKCPMRDIRISDHGSWRHIHWNAIVSAYGESPFFDYYADDLRPFFERKWTYLFDFNMEITNKLCELLDVRPDITISDAYADAAALGADDFRDAIRPKHPQDDPAFDVRPYYQVHALRQGFQPNMSALDLLCNEGPEGIFWL